MWTRVGRDVALCPRGRETDGQREVTRHGRRRGRDVFLQAAGKLAADVSYGRRNEEKMFYKIENGDFIATEHIVHIYVEYNPMHPGETGKPYSILAKLVTGDAVPLGYVVSKDDAQSVVDAAAAAMG
jgi:hypothetical protein